MAFGRGWYLSFELRDNTSEIRFIAFDENAQRLAEYIHANDIYLVSEASVQRASNHYFHLHTFELILGNNTKFEHCREDNLHLPFIRLNLTNIAVISMTKQENDFFGNFNF